MGEIGGNHGGSSGGEIGGKGGGETGGNFSGIASGTGGEIGGRSGGTKTGAALAHETGKAGTEGISALHSSSLKGFSSNETTSRVSSEISEMKSLEEARAEVTQHHHDAVLQILETNGKYMSPEDRARVEAGAKHIVVEKHVPGRSYDGRYTARSGTIEVTAITPAQMERTTIHETNHFASKHGEIIVPRPDKGGYDVHETVGMRHTSYFHNTKTGELSLNETHGRGLNEGMTTMYTNEQLTAKDPEKGMAAEREEVYYQATEVSKQFQNIMGKDALAEAYYGGKTNALQEKIDALGGKGTFEALEKSMDKTVSKDYVTRVEGMKESNEILASLKDAIKARDKGGKKV